MALHSGGVTLGPYSGDTFALVEAKGAKGTHVLNAQVSLHALMTDNPAAFND
ncbi:hypothetical protein [Providencia rettgeri]|uniref:hypothetical protein n=1 Tax=Providencia rettgeri TaxID=587 RepID=UPI003AF323BA